MVILLIEKIVSLFLIMFLGFLLVKIGIFESGDSKYLSKLCVYLATPCSILYAFQVDFTPDVRDGLLLAFGAAALVHLCLLIFTGCLERILHLKPVEAVSVMYSNAGNLIIPLVSSILGEEWVIYTSAFLTVQLVLLWSHGKSSLCGEKSISMKKVLLNINMIAVFAGIFCLLFKIQISGPLQSTLSSLSSMIGPLAMLISGMLIAGMDLKSMLANRRLWMTAGLRLVATPLLIMGVLLFLGKMVSVPNAKSILMIILLADLTPSASTVVQQAQIYGADANYASAINAITTLCCIITMPVMIILYQML